MSTGRRTNAVRAVGDDVIGLIDAFVSMPDGQAAVRALNAILTALQPTVSCWSRDHVAHSRLSPSDADDIAQAMSIGIFRLLTAVRGGATPPLSWGAVINQTSRNAASAYLKSASHTGVRSAVGVLRRGQHLAYHRDELLNASGEMPTPEAVVLSFNAQSIRRRGFEGAAKSGLFASLAEAAAVVQRIA